MIFTTRDREIKKPKKVRLWSVFFWLLVWEIAARWIGQDILLVSPATVLLRLVNLSGTSDFWRSIGFSFLRIAGGFFIAVFTGTLFAALSARFVRIKELFAPFIYTIKAIPVASFIILVLIWVSSRNLSLFISFLMVFPILYTGILEGVQSTDQKLLEMAAVFRIPLRRSVRYIYVSHVLPFFRSSCSVALGFCWKSGIAAEVIGIPDGSIGEKLYKAKIYLNTPDLFSWTLVIVLLSLLFEKLFLFGTDRFVRHLERA